MTFVTLPALRQRVHTRTRRARPATSARIETRLGSQRRRVSLCAWLIVLPTRWGPFVGLSPPPPGRARQPFPVMLRDASGHATASWFGWRYLARALERGQRLVPPRPGARHPGAGVLPQPAW